MNEARIFRLDTADLAANAGWHVLSTAQSEEFAKDGVTIEVGYSSDDAVLKLHKRGPDSRQEIFGSETDGKGDLLRSWLAGRRSTVADRSPKTLVEITSFDRYPNGWTPEDFVGAIEDRADRAFMLRFLELVNGNSRLPAEGTHPRLFGGNRPGGALFVYPFGRRNPPYKFFVNHGQLLIAGCWKTFPKVQGHAGFADLARMLDLDEQGPEKRVPVAGLDPDAVWEVGGNVSRAIN